MQQFPDLHLDDKVVVHRGVVLGTDSMVRCIVERTRGKGAENRHCNHREINVKIGGKVS